MRTNKAGEIGGELRLVWVYERIWVVARGAWGVEYERRCEGEWDDMCVQRGAWVCVEYERRCEEVQWVLWGDI